MCFTTIKVVGCKGLVPDINFVKFKVSNLWYVCFMGIEELMCNCVAMSKGCQIQNSVNVSGNKYTSVTIAW